MRELRSHLGRHGAKAIDAEAEKRVGWRQREDEDALLLTMHTAPLGSFTTWAKHLGWVSATGEEQKSRISRTMERFKTATGASKRSGKMTKLVSDVRAEEHRDIRRAQDGYRYGISIDVANCIITGGNVDNIEETPSVWADGATYVPSRNTGRKLLRSPQICAS